MKLHVWWFALVLAACGGAEPAELQAEPGTSPASGAGASTTAGTLSGGAGAASGAGAAGRRAGSAGAAAGGQATAGTTGAGSPAAGVSAADSGGRSGSTAAGSGGAPSGAAGRTGSIAAGSGGASSGVAGTGATAAGTGGPVVPSEPAPQQAGRRDETLTVAGIERTFVYYEPPGLDRAKAVPVVLVAHGFVMSGDMMFNITGYTQLADEEGFVALFPDGDPLSAGPWNVGDGICGLGAFVAGLGDDQVFIDEMLDFVQGERAIDREHIFMTGFSMGGYFSNETGCLRPEIRGIAPHSGGTHDLSACVTRRKPAIIHHFVDDTLIGYECGLETRDRWVARNGCSPLAPDVVMVDGGTCEYYKGCPEDGQVAFCSYQLPAEGGGELVIGHAWSGGLQEVPSGGSFAIPATASATRLSWEFWKKYAW